MLLEPIKVFLFPTSELPAPKTALLLVTGAGVLGTEIGGIDTTGAVLDDDEVEVVLCCCLAVTGPPVDLKSRAMV